MTDPARTAEVRALVAEQLPGAEVLGGGGGGDPGAEDSSGGMDNSDVLHAAYAGPPVYAPMPGQQAQYGAYACPPVYAPMPGQQQQQQAQYGAYPGPPVYAPLPGQQQLQQAQYGASTLPYPTTFAMAPQAQSDGGGCCGCCCRPRAQRPAPGGAAAEGDVLRRRVESGTMTVSVPRHLLARLPAFLKLLQTETGGGAAPGGGGGLVRDWGVSDSTLEEVFLRLAAVNTTNAPVGGAAGGLPALSAEPMSVDPSVLAPVALDGSPDAPLLPAPMPATAGAGARPAPLFHKGRTAAGGASGGDHRLCVLCGAAPPALVTLFTAKHVAVASADLVCDACATHRDANEIAEIAASSAAAPAAAALAPPSKPSDHVIAELPKPSLPLPRVPVSAAVDVGPEEVGGTSSEPLLGEDPSAAPPVPPFLSSGGAPSSLAWADGTPDPYDVPFFTQFGAILLLRLRLQSKYRWSNCCMACYVVLGVILTMLTGGIIQQKQGGLLCANNGGASARHP